MSHSVASTEDSEQLEPMSRAEITKMIADEVKSLTAESITNRNKAALAYVQQQAFLVGCNVKEEDMTVLGGTLCTEMMHLFHKLQPILAHVVVNDFSITSALEQCTQETLLLRARVDRLTVSTATPPEPPPPFQTRTIRSCARRC
jgi:hypothetical protein